MRRVIIESPFASVDLDTAIDYLQACIVDTANRGETPYASHQMLGTVLDDRDPATRTRGIEMGFRWWDVADEIVFYTDLGWSPGMREAWRRAILRKMPRAIRALSGPPIPYNEETT